MHHRAIAVDYSAARFREVEEALLVCGSTLYNPYKDGLTRRDLTFLGVMGQRHEHIAFGIIGPDAAPGDTIGKHFQAMYLAANALGGLCRQPDGLTIGQAELLDVFRVHEDDLELCGNLGDDGVR